MMKNQKKTLKSARNYVNILDVRLTSTSIDEVLTKISDFLHSSYKFSLFTLNPEILIEANSDKYFKKILNLGDINVPDGIGVTYASKFLYGKPLKVTPGRKLFLELIKASYENNWKVFLLGGLQDEAVTASSKLQMANSKLQIQASSGPRLDKNAEPVSERDKKIEMETIKKINEFKPDILFVGFGAPKQEKWIHKWLPKLNCGGAMTVGGTFSYISGRSRLPPYWMERCSLEWLWRLLHEPKRAFRILNAVVIFPLKVLCSKFWQKRA